MCNPRFPEFRDLGRIIILSVLNIALFQTLLFMAAYRLPGGLAAVLGAIQPLCVMFLLWITEGKKPKVITIWAALVGVLGMALLLISAQSVFDSVGIAVALLGAVCMASGVWLTGRWKIQLPVTALSGWQLLIGGIMLVPAAEFVDAPLPNLTWMQYAAYGWLSIAGALIAYGLWFRGIKRLPGVAVASLGLLSPLVAVILGWSILGQQMGVVQVIGLVTVLSSVLIVQRSSHASTR